MVIPLQIAVMFLVMGIVSAITQIKRILLDWEISIPMIYLEPVFIAHLLIFYQYSNIYFFSYFNYIVLKTGEFYYFILND